jgi:putative two-component system response regulator
LLQLAEIIAQTHHERWDGTGYMGLRGEDIPMAGRIVSVADVFDALTSERPYKKAWSQQEAIEEIQRQSGRQFDPRVVEALLRVVNIEQHPAPV